MSSWRESSTAPGRAEKCFWLRSRMEKLPCDWSADNRMLCLGKPERLT